MTIREKIELLQKPVWTYRDIMVYMDIGKTQANIVKNLVIDNGGATKYSSKYVQTEKVLELLSTTREKEIGILKTIEEKEAE